MDYANPDDVPSLIVSIGPDNSPLIERWTVIYGTTTLGEQIDYQLYNLLKNIYG